MTDDKTIENVETSIFSLLAQCFYFAGVHSTSDSITFEYYYEMFNNDFRTEFVEDVVKYIILPTNYYEEYIMYIKKRLVMILYSIQPKDEYRVKIGLLSMTSHFTILPAKKLLETEISTKHNIDIQSYLEEDQYDLVLSTVSKDLTTMNYDYFYHITNIGIDLDIFQINKMISQISLEKYNQLGGKSYFDFVFNSI